MNGFNNRANQYKQTAILTASKTQILLMLYEAAIRYSKQALTALEKHDLPAKSVAIGKVHDIVNELTNSLNHDVGGKIADDLERLYNFCIEQLFKANLENQKEPLESVIRILENLLDGFKGAVAQLKAQGKAS